MKIHRISGPPSPEMAEALACFETEFQYPLGPGRSFAISHGADYSRFFRSMGEAKIYIAEIAGKIIGALAVVNRSITLADGSVLQAAYICDVKVVSAYRGRLVLGRLVLRARDEIIASGCHRAYSIVMSGSPPSDQHTGRLGIPHFGKIGELTILRFDTSARLKFREAPSEPKSESYHRVAGANSSLCSKISPIPLTAGGACGSLVDTRCGKRLWQSDGNELISAHLVDVHFDTTGNLIELVGAAIAKAAEFGFPGLFLALPSPLNLSKQMLTNFLEIQATIAAATVYGTGIPPGEWLVNSSEI